MNNIIQKIWNIQLFRFVCVGIFNTLFDITLFNILVHVMNIRIIFANSLSVIVSITISYLLNSYLVFRTQRDWRSFWLFFLVTGLSSVIIQDIVIIAARGLTATVVMHINQSLFNFSMVVVDYFKTTVVKLCAVAVGMVWNFVLYKNLVFRHTISRIENPDES